MTTTGKNPVMIYGPKTDGTYVVEFRTAEGETLTISIPRTETAVIRPFQERMPAWALRAGRGRAARGWLTSMRAMGRAAPTPGQRGDDGYAGMPPRSNVDASPEACTLPSGG